MSWANAEVVELDSRNVARLALLGEIRGQQARINDGVETLVVPDADTAQVASARLRTARALEDMDQLMRQYRQLVDGTDASAGFDDLFGKWQAFDNGVHVHLLGEPAVPGLPLVAGQDLGTMTLAITYALEARAESESAAAVAAVSTRRQAYQESQMQLTIGLSTALLIAAGIGIVAARSHSARRRAASRFGALVQASSDVIAVVDADGRHRYLSPSTETVMGYRPDDLVDTHFDQLLHPDDAAQAYAMYAELLADTDQREHRFEMRVRHADGGWRWHEVVARSLLNNPAVDGIVVNHRDITERRHFQDRLAYEASHDALTGLANRTAFLADLDRAVASDREHGGQSAVMFIDLNGFKQINDTWGHDAGDALLVGFAEALRANTLGADTAARLGGDEFGVVLCKIGSPENAEAVARRIIAALAEPIDVGGQRLHARASIGIALSDGGCPAEEVLRRADLAMYHVKRQKINGWRCYDPSVETDRTVVIPTAEELCTAIHDDQLHLVYQPIVALHDGAVLGVEALVRWQHPTLGLLGPQEFIPLAEAGGLIAPLGEWVLRGACAQVAAWRQRGGPAANLALSVNLSPRQLDEPTLTERVLAILADTGFTAGDLILEITENALVNEGLAIPVLRELHDHGIRIALDDFGTGYSSLRYLTNLPVDILKLDKCFVAELDGTPTGSAVAEAVIRLSRSLNIDTIAEGVEDAAQANELTLLGSRLAQGYHFAKPLEPAAFTALLDATHTPPTREPAPATGLSMTPY
ncbi:EAL domain-containing protein [Actinoplanes sp. NPDC051346]|uniref:putative bifunctional diguanylate cyclase/phosphodiesterase n=1 Tax=Actinoplanes sp. NPDC051346 TaxID=3155048 RepID=UPI00343FEAF6